MDFLYGIFSYRLVFVTDLLRYLFLFLDGIVYNFIQPLYSASIELSNIRDILQQEKTVELIANKLYVFLGIFMLFKLAFSIISMIANPDLTDDKQKGLGKVFTHAIITLVLVVVMPSIFRMAYNLQDFLITDGYLRGMFGETAGGKVANGAEGAELARNVFSVFIEVVNRSDATAVATIEEFKKDTGESVDIPKLNENNVMMGHKDSKYNVAYMMLVSTIVGGVLAFSFLKMGMEIAVRSLKLFVLEIISPIAVISYVDPASASKGIFAKWLALTIKVYLSLFIRLAILYFFTSLLSGIDVKSFSGNLGWLASLILILAIIAFMQSAPKLLEEVFGYKPSEDSKAISGIAKGALGLGIGAAYTGIQSARAASSQQTGLRKFTSGLGGLVKGAAKGGFIGASSGQSKGHGSAYANAKKAFQGSEDYKALMQAKGKGKAKREGSKYEKNTPKWFDTGNATQEEADFLAGVDAATAAKYGAITGFGADEMKAAFRKNEAEKVANNKTFSSKYAAAKNAAGDASFAKKLAANDLRAKELAAKKAENSKNTSAARKATLEENLKNANATHARIVSERSVQIALMSDPTISADQRSVAAAKKAALDLDLIDINTDISTIASDLGVATADALADQTAWDTAITDVASAQRTLEVASGKSDKADKLLETMQKEPEYSRDVAKDSGISRSAVL